MEKLGGGGMGVVYKGEDTRLKRTVALKFLPPDLTRDEETKTRFAHEAQAASALQHNNICNIHDIEETNDGQTFIVMDCYEGETLKVRIAKGQLRIDEAIRIAIQVADGLSEAHAHGIIHRDIKPANIMITPRGDVKILDFGLAKLLGQTLLTKSGSTIGTAAYMSPEQARGEKVDERTDIWSVGVVLYEMLAGRRPFGGEFEQAMLYEIVHEQPKPLKEYRKDVPDELVKIVSRALEKDVAKRYESFQKMLVDLRTLQASSVPLTALTARVRSRVLQWPVLVPAMVVVLALALYLGWPFMEELLAGTEPITLLVMPFENRTGDAKYDNYSSFIQMALVASLGESSRLRVVGHDRLNDLLKQAGKAELKPDDLSLALDLCRRDSVRVLVKGVFTKTREEFTTEVELLNVNDGAVFQKARSTGKGTNSFLKSQIDLLSHQIAAGSGVPVRVVEREERPVQEVTTTSEEAYNYYVRGDREREKLLFAEALPFFRRAVELDSTFAMAHLALSGLEPDPKRRAEALEKAKKYADRISRKERLRIEIVSERDFDKRLAMMRRLATQFPNDKEALFMLGNALRNRWSSQFEAPEAIELLNRALALDPTYTRALNVLGYTYLQNMNDPKKALEVFKRLAVASPGDPDPFDSMAEAYYAIGMLDSAIVKYKEVLFVKPNFGSAALHVSYVLALKEDYDNAFRWIEHYGTVGSTRALTEERALIYETKVHRKKSFLHFWLGALSKAHAELVKGLEVAKRLPSKNLEAQLRLEHFFLAANAGRQAQAAEDLAEFLRVLPQTNQGYVMHDSLWFGIGNALLGAKLGNYALAESALASARRHASTGSWLSYVNVNAEIHSTEGELLLAKGQLDSAIQHFKRFPGMHVFTTHFSAYSSPSQELSNYANPRDGLARAYVRKGDLDAAIKEYERITTLDTVSRDRRLIHPLHRYELAKLYEKKGMKEKAIAQFERFLFLWKNADRDRPEPKDARKRLAALKRTT
jgi:tetratricopeptide (TPR) repeat protein